MADIVASSSAPKSSKDAHAHFVIDSTFEAVASLAEQIAQACRSAYPETSDLPDTVHLCVAEALNNVVEHAYQGAPDKQIFADLHVSSDQCTITLMDEGRPMPGGEPPAGVCGFDIEDLDGLPEGGFGWMMIRVQMDGVSYERRGDCNVLQLTKSIQVA